MSGDRGEICRLGRPRPLRAGDVERASRSISRAFAWHEPWGAWLLPEESTRERILRSKVRDEIRDRYLPDGECFTIGGLCVTLWEPPASDPAGAAFAAPRNEAEYAIYGEMADALRAGDRLLDSLRPAGEHWYLDTIATDPDFRGTGLGGRLLDHDLALHDRERRRCALDTHTRANVAFYERRGFELVARDVLPDGGPDLFVMAREPCAT